MDGLFTSFLSKFGDETKDVLRVTKLITCFNYSLLRTELMNSIQGEMF